MSDGYPPSWLGDVYPGTTYRQHESTRLAEGAQPVLVTDNWLDRVPDRRHYSWLEVIRTVSAWWSAVMSTATFALVFWRIT